MQRVGQTLSQAWQPQQSSFRVKVIIGGNGVRSERSSVPAKRGIYLVKYKGFSDGFTRRGRQLELLRNIAAGDENYDGFSFLNRDNLS